MPTQRCAMCKEEGHKRPSCQHPRAMRLRAAYGGRMPTEKRIHEALAKVEDGTANATDEAIREAHITNVEELHAEHPNAHIVVLHRAPDWLRLERRVARQRQQEAADAAAALRHAVRQHFEAPAAPPQPPAPNPFDDPPAPAEPIKGYEQLGECAICYTNHNGIALGCGHLFCGECASKIHDCATCRKPIRVRTRLFL